MLWHVYHLLSLLCVLIWQSAELFLSHVLRSVSAAVAQKFLLLKYVITDVLLSLLSGSGWVSDGSVLELAGTGSI